MKSLLVTAMVLSCFSWESHAVQSNQVKPTPPAQSSSQNRDQNSNSSRESTTPNKNAESDRQNSDPSEQTHPAPKALAPTKPMVKNTAPIAKPMVKKAPQAPAKTQVKTVTPARKSTPEVAKNSVAKTNVPKASSVSNTTPIKAPETTKNKVAQGNAATTKTSLAKTPAVIPPAGKPALVHGQAPLTQVPGNKPYSTPPAVIPLIGRQVPTSGLLHQVQLNNQLVMKQNPQVRAFVEQRGQFYRTNFQAQLLQRQQIYLAPTYLAPLRVEYRPWARYGFYAYAYEVHPMVEFYAYFNNPCVSWFYNDYDEEFYRPYYGQYVAQYPELARGYVNVGIYFPTEEFINLNISLSGMEIETQVNYRRAMIYLSNRLSQRLHTPIGRHEVVVTHYQMLPNNRAVLIDGFVDHGAFHIPFRALIDLFDADDSQLIAVGNNSGPGQLPSVYQVRDVYELNDQLQGFGGSLDAPAGF